MTMHLGRVWFVFEGWLVWAEVVVCFTWSVPFERMGVLYPCTYLVAF